jgi:holo-[acyl-carrier protein] synthase
MGLRCGIDIASIQRIRAAVLRQGEAFLRKTYTPSELDYCLARGEESRYESLAVRYAAKEAVGKALGTGLMRNGIALSDIEILRDEYGTPSVRLSGAALATFEALGGVEIAISLSHEGDVAAANCVLTTNLESAPKPTRPAQEGRA